MSEQQNDQLPTEELVGTINPEARIKQLEEEKKVMQEAFNKKMQASNQLMAQDNGLIIGGSLEERYRVCTLYAKSGMLPKSYDTPEKVFAGIQYAIELGFADKPLTALRNIAIINGQPSLWGEMPLALVKSSGLLVMHEEFFEDKKGNKLPETCVAEEVFAAVCLIQRVGEPIKRFAYTQDDRTSLGVAAIWKSFTKIMMKRKARAIALKDVFPDTLLGIRVAEYDDHLYLDETRDKSITVLPPQEEKLNKFKDKFKPKDVEVQPEVIDG